MSSLPKFRHTYSPLQQIELTNEIGSLPSRTSHRLRLLLSYAVVFLALAVAFALGRWSTSVTEQSSRPPISNVERVFSYDRNFSYPPSDITNKAWESLYPKMGTYFTYEPVAPRHSTFSAFHQLHCLDGIRHAYWQVYDAAIEGRRLVVEDIPMMSSPSHVRHCTDLIRQSLMCYADTTVEEENPETGGVHGFGVAHTCRNWDELIGLINKWQEARK